MQVREGRVETVRCAVVGIGCDLRAGCKLCGLLSHSAKTEDAYVALRNSHADLALMITLNLIIIIGASKQMMNIVKGSLKLLDF